MDPYKQNLEMWNKAASLYEEKFMDLHIYDESYDFFCDCIKAENASVLEIGCGPGNISRYLLNKRPDFKIEATDVSPNMIKLAKKNVPGVNFTLLDSREINSLKRNFDAIVCGFCLPYISEEDSKKLYSDIFHLLQNNGYLYLSFIEGNPDDSGSVINSLGDKGYFYYYKPEDVSQLLKNAGFTLAKTFKINYPKSGNEFENQIVFICKISKK